jgi:hypothetical protein
MRGSLLRFDCFTLGILAFLLIVYLRWFCRQLFLAYHAAIFCWLQLLTYIGTLVYLTILSWFCLVHNHDFMFNPDRRVRFVLLKLRNGFILNVTFLNSFLSGFYARPPEFRIHHVWVSIQLFKTQICAIALSHLNVVAFNVHHDNEITMFNRDNYLVPLSSNTTLLLSSFCL